MNTKLPIYEHKQEIIDSLSSYDTVIITAETGSGKSTQVPQYLYEAGYKEITVTQPRRIACISLAERVSKEMNENVVGYQTAFESSKDENTKILFCTDGLQMAHGIQDNPDAVLIIDEAHEWNLNIEGIIAWLKLARQEGLKLKVIIMSATIDTSLSEYLGAKLISVAGRSYPVSKSVDSSFSLTENVMKAAREGKNVLAFLPGKGEISETMEIISNGLRDISAVILPLHGDLMVEEQRRVFKHYSYPKIVLSTNVAQTSLTIPDIDIVIDSGLERRIEVVDGVESLVLGDISKADVEQRAGRAGRTRPGEYILCSDLFEAERMEFPLPEIERLDIDRVVLRLAEDKIDAEKVQFFHQPDIKQIRDAKKMLENIGAISEDEITTTGKELLHIPVSVRFGAMILEAKKYGRQIMDDVITMTAIMEVGTLLDFTGKVIDKFGNERKSVYRDFTKRKNSDLLAELDVFRKMERNEFDNNAGLSEKAFGRIQKYRDKMQYLLKNIPEDEYYEEDALRCVIKGLLDSLMKTDYGDKFVNGDGVMFILPQSTCITKKPEFLVGIPKLISGTYEIFHIVAMATGISRETLLELIPPEQINRYRLPYSFMYNPETETISCLVREQYNGIQLGLQTETISKDSDEYAEIMREMPWLTKRTSEEQVLFENNIYPIIKEEGKEFVELPEEAVMNAKHKHVKSYYGKNMICKCNDISSKNLFELREKIQSYVQAKSVAVAAYPEGATTLEEVYDLWKRVNEANNKIVGNPFLSLACKGSKMIPRPTSKTYSKALSETVKETRKYLTQILRARFPAEAIREKGTEASDYYASQYEKFFARIIRETNFDNFMLSVERIERGFNNATAGNLEEQEEATNEEKEYSTKISKKKKKEVSAEDALANLFEKLEKVKSQTKPPFSTFSFKSKNSEVNMSVARDLESAIINAEDAVKQGVKEIFLQEYAELQEDQQTREKIKGSISSHIAILTSENYTTVLELLKNSIKRILKTEESESQLPRP